jgi:hypothetical protein
MIIAPETPNRSIFINSRSPLAMTSSIRYFEAPGRTKPDMRLMTMRTNPNNKSLRRGQIMVLKTFLSEARYFAIFQII